MITAKAIWTDKERYIGEATSRHALVMDTAPEKTASTPMELVLIALCGCTASDVVGILRKKREPFTSLEVRRLVSAPPAILRSIRKSVWFIASPAKFPAKRWKTPSACRKKNIVPCRRCWKKRRRLLRRSNWWNRLPNDPEKGENQMSIRVSFLHPARLPLLRTDEDGSRSQGDCFEEHDISTDLDARRDMTEQHDSTETPTSGRFAGEIVDVIVGFDPVRLDQFLDPAPSSDAVTEP